MSRKNNHNNCLSEKEALELIDQRDYWEEKATELANDVGAFLGVDVGEHSLLNCPVQEAINAIYAANLSRGQ